MNGASPARERRNAIAAQRLAAAPAPVVIRTRRSLLERIGAAVEAPFVALAARWHLRSLQSRRESLLCAHLATCDELSALKSLKFAKPWQSTPTLDERIKATAKDCSKFAGEVEAVEKQIEALIKSRLETQ